MIGNSLKSDIAPALAVGAWAIHIPFYVTWQIEQYAIGDGGNATRVEDFDHERLFRAESFRDILQFF